jgi:hypothetical protein
MKKFLKNPLFYTNVLLLFLVVMLAANVTQAKLPGFVQKAFAAVADIFGEGNIGFAPLFTGAASPTNQIGDSVIYQSSAGNIGIGTTGPGSKLDVSSAAGKTTIRTSNTAADGDPLISWFMPGVIEWTAGIDDSDSDKFKIANSGGLNTLTRLTIDGAGNVGIGDTNPSSKLTINSGDETTNPTIFMAGKYEGGINSQGGIRPIGTQQIGPYSGGVSLMRKYYDGSVYRWEDVLVTTASGNVGIGTKNPQAALEVGSGGVIRLQPRTENPGGLVDGMIWVVQ